MSRLSFLPIFAALALAACASDEQDRSPVSGIASAPGGAHVGATVEPDANAILALPSEAGGGRLSERLYANGWRQSQALGGGNDLAIDIETDAPGEARAGRIPMGKPTQEGVRKEILSRFPGMAMRIVGKPMQNVLGPYGLAIGAGAGGLRCAFAWQWVDDLRGVRVTRAGAGGSASFFRGRALPASIRMRLCRRGVTADQIASWYEQLEVTDMAAIERVAENARAGVGAAAVEGKPGAVARADRARGDIVDPSESLEASLPHPAPTRLVNRSGARRHFARRHTAPAAAPESGLTSQQAIFTPFAPAAPAADYGGRRYLAPVAGAPAPKYAAAPQPATRGAGFGPVRLNPGLPPEAYRGPSAQASASAGPRYLSDPGR